MSITPLANRPHDHSHCVHSALAEADALCTRQGLRLTALRRRVLELVWQSHKPLGAYDILAVLSEQDGRRAAPPTVYRALDFLLDNGLVHRIASLNAFHVAIELEQASISDAIINSAKGVGFSVETQTVEVVGLCGSCRSAA